MLTSRRSRLKGSTSKQWRAVFNKKGGRYQTDMLAGHKVNVHPEHQQLHQTCKDLTKAFEIYIDGSDEEGCDAFHVVSVIGMRSTEKCDAQRHHYDYSQANLSEFSLLLAVDETPTSIEVCVPMDIREKQFEIKQIKIPRCGLLVFDGGVNHGGAKYKQVNYRLFWYAVRGKALADAMVANIRDGTNEIFLASCDHHCIDDVKKRKKRL